MQINLHELSKPIFWEKYKKKIFSMLSAKIFTQHALKTKSVLLFLLKHISIIKRELA